VGRCPADYYFDDDSESCVLCGNKVTCDGGSKSKVSDWVLDPGHWRTDDDSKQLELCPLDSACQGGGEGSGDKLCSVGYTGVVCAVCATVDNGAEHDYYQSGGQCKKCGDDSAGVITTFFLFLLLAVAALAILGCAGRSVLKDSYDKLAALRTRFFAELWDVAKFKVVFSAYQIIASTSWSLKVKFPEPYETIQGALSRVMEFSLAKILPIGCLVVYDHHTHTIMVTLIPLGIVACLLLMHIHSMKSKRAMVHATGYDPDKKGGGKAKVAVLQGEPFLNAALLVLYVVLPTTSTVLFRTFDCVEFDDKTKWLHADLKIDCDSAKHQGMVAYAWLFILVFPIGVNAAYFLILYQHRHKINPPLAMTENDAVFTNSIDKSLDPIRQIFRMYRPAYWYFEIIDMSRRIIMMCTLIFVKGDATRAGVGFLLAFLSAAMYRELVPFSTVPVNALSTAAQWQICMVYFAGIIILGQPFSYEPLTLGLILTAVFFGLIGMAIALQFSHGSSTIELEHLLLEYQAREADLRLSIKDLLGAVDGVADAQSTFELEGDPSPFGVTMHVTNDSVSPRSPRRASVGPELALKNITPAMYAKADGFNKAFYPCYVMEHAQFANFTKLPFHEDALEVGWLEMLTPTSHSPASSNSYFISQNWEGMDGSGVGGAPGSKHPDNAINTKAYWLKNIKKHFSIPEEGKIWIWFDVFSVPQMIRENQRKAVNSLCYYCQMCTRFLPLVRDKQEWLRLHQATDLKPTLPSGEIDAYMGRGWCRVEVIAALCPKRTLTGKWRPGPINLRYRFHTNPEDCGIGPMLSKVGLLNPVLGGFTTESDRPIVIDLTRTIAARYLEYMDSGSRVWSETLDMDNVPPWVRELGTPGAEVTTGQRSEA